MMHLTSVPSMLLVMRRKRIFSASHRPASGATRCRFRLKFFAEANSARFRRLSRATCLRREVQRLLATSGTATTSSRWKRREVSMMVAGVRSLR